MNPFRYDEVGDAHQHLNYTVLMTEAGIPYYIRAISHGNWEWYVQALGDEDYEREKVDIRKMGLTFDPVQLGYCNHNDTCSYLIRRPVRMWKQGLTTDHIKAKTGFIEEELLSSGFLRDTILNIYPTMAEAFKTVQQNGTSKAFHRDFAFVTQDYPEIGIEYKGDVIGMVNPDGDLDIDDKFFFVKEQLEEVIYAKD